MRSLILQGGGCRCFFQLGLLATAGDALGSFDEIGAVSASTGMATAHVLGLHRESFERFHRAVARNRANFYPRRALRGERVTPHHEMYRRTLLECVSAADVERLRRAPVRLRFLVAIGRIDSRVLTLLAGAARLATGRPTSLLAPHVVDVRDLDGPEALADAVLASSAVPPFIPQPRIAGRPALDGGALERVPLSLASPGAEVTAILTRPRPVTPLPPSVRVVAPPLPLPIAIWDYADARALSAVWDAGRRAGDTLRAAREAA